MELLEARLVGVRPFEDLTVRFADENDAARAVTVIHGAGGVGKTTLLAAIASTRPGCAVVQPPPHLGGRGGAVVTRWSLRSEDPERPHPLDVATPNATLPEGIEIDRKEQAVFERLAGRGGFVFVGFSAIRSFSRQPIAIFAPKLGVARYDVRAQAPFDDVQHADLGRETKQAIAYAAISSSVSRPDRHDHAPLGEAMARALAESMAPSGFRPSGLDPSSLEPLFEDETGSIASFDALPTCARHLAAFAALPVRALWAAYPGRAPRSQSAVVAIDEVNLYQDATTQGALVAALRRALPEVQWIITTTSATVAASVEASDVIALRRAARDGEIEVHTGVAARTH